MKLVASLMVGAGELNRYLDLCIDSLLDCCDEIAVRCEGEQEREYLAGLASERVRVLTVEPSFFVHEGAARDQLLHWTLGTHADYVVAVDADELISDGAALRKACEEGHDAYGLTTMECWDATENGLCVRVDGGWKPTRVPALWRVPNRTDGLRIADRALACGRVPTTVDRRGAHPADADIIHFGWANEGERVARHHRYAVADGGRFHRSTHLDSILNPCSRVQLERMDWPAGLAPYRDAILAKVTSTESPTVAK